MDNIDQGITSVQENPNPVGKVDSQVTKRSKPASRRRKQTGRPTNRTAEPEDFSPRDSSNLMNNPNREIPRMTQWRCREEVMWTHSKILGGSHLYKPVDEDPETGEVGPTVFTVVIPDWEEPHLFDYSRGFWFPAGKTVIDPMVDRILPRQFDPLNFNCLVDPRLVNYARYNLPIKDKFRFKAEVENKVQKMDEMVVPEPLDPNWKPSTVGDNPMTLPDPTKKPGMSF